MNGFVALKLDISKAYDRVEWSFLKQTLLMLGVSPIWVDLIMRRVSTASLSVIINGVPKRMIQPEKGLMHGCLLSPYLFIICTEAFSNFLVKAENNQLIRGLKFAKEVSITHLLFANDSLVFSRASVADCKHLKEIFDIYAVASRQIFNFQKSSLFISGQIPTSQAAAIKDIFKLNVVSKHEKYLGLPSMIGRKKMIFFNEVKLKVLNKIAGL